MTPKPNPSGELALQKRADEAKISLLPVSDIMDQRPLLITVGSKIYSTIRSLAIHNTSGAPVVDKQNRLLGVISEYDLLLQAATRDLAEPIEFVTEVFTLGPNTTLREALIIFYKRKLRTIPVIDAQKKVMGVLSRQHVLNRLTLGPK